MGRVSLIDNSGIYSETINVGNGNRVEVETIGVHRSRNAEANMMGKSSKSIIKITKNCGCGSARKSDNCILAKIFKKYWRVTQSLAGDYYKCSSRYNLITSMLQHS